MVSLSSLRFNVVHVDGTPLAYFSESSRFLRKISLLFAAFLFVGMSQGFAWISGSPFRFYKPVVEAKLPMVAAEKAESALVVDPTITVRFWNPQFNCTLEEYCLDVEFQSNQSGKELFGMNVRFFYDNNILELINFRGFQGGYGPASPNPPLNSYSATAGPALFNFGGGADYINGGMQKTNLNATPIFIATGNNWTKLFQICFTVDDPNADVNNFCPPVVWDLEYDPVNGGFLSGSDGVVMTVLTNGQSGPVTENVDPFNWDYDGVGPAPYGAPLAVTCSSIACGSCNLLVSTHLDYGPNSLRSAIQCAMSGDTVTFASNMGGLTINLDTSRILINKNLYIRSNLVNRVKITSTTLPGLFEIGAGKTVEFKDIDITSGLTLDGNEGAAFKNQGLLRLLGVKVFKNVSLPAGQYLIRNKPGSSLTLIGNCFIEIP